MLRVPRGTLATFFARCGIALVVAFAFVAGGVVAVNHGIDARVKRIRRVHLTVAPAPPGGANYLIIGSDTRAFVTDPAEENAIGGPNSGCNCSDTLMVVHIEPGSKQALVVSFPRDLMVDVPGLSGKNRINLAYAHGGPQGVIDALKANFDIDINHYVEVDFQSFKAVVDAIGKVSVWVPGEVYDSFTGFHGIFGQGCYALNGNASLDWVRARHMVILDPNGPITYPQLPGKRWRLLDVRSDLDRIERQQAFIRKLASVAIQRSLGNPFLAAEAADTALKYVKADTGLSRSDVNALIRAFRTINVNDSASIQFETLPVLPDPNNPTATLVAAPEALAVVQQLRTFGSETAPLPAVAPSAVHVAVLDGTGTADVAGAAKALAGQGFVVISTGRAAHDVAITQVRYGTESAEAAKTLLDYLPDAVLVPDAALDGTGRVDVVLGASFTTIYVAPTTTTTTTAPGVTTTAPPTTTLPPVPSTTLPPDRCPN